VIMDLWLDSVLSTPYIGISFQPRFVPEAVLPHAAQCLVEELGDTPWKLTSRGKIFEFDLTGFEILIKPDGVDVSFKYPIMLICI